MALLLALPLLAANALAAADGNAPDQADYIGPSLRVRSGVALPSGGADETHKLAETYGVLIPFDVEAGYWVLPKLFVGAHAAYGLLTIADGACAPPLECSGSDFRFGAGLEYRFDLVGPYRKWIGAGAGWELARFSIKGGGGEAARVDSGPEYLYLQVGCDFPIRDVFGVGPFAAMTLGEFRTATLEQADGSKTKYAIQDSKMHEWFFLGVRGVWTP